MAETATQQIPGTIPEVDVSGYLAGDRKATEAAAGQLAQAFEDVGFFYLVGHPINWQTVEDMYDWDRRFHELPMEVKESLRLGSGFAGYLPLGAGRSVTSTVAGDARKPNLNAAFIVTPPESGLNRWPPLEGFQEVVTDYFTVMRSLAFRMLPLVARSLELPEDFFTPHFDGPLTAALRMSHYPVVPHEEGQFGQDAHTDNPFITFLPSNPTGGLAVRPIGQDWINVPPLPGAFLVNSGNTLARWTNDRYLATPHRVLNASGRDRYALPFFYAPLEEAVVAPATRWVSADRPARYQPIVYRDLKRTFLTANYGNYEKS